MKKSIMQSLFLCTLVFGVIQPQSIQAEKLIGMEISPQKYVSGALVGSIFSFGTGHLMQGQTVKGLTLMSAQLASIALGSIGWARMVKDAGNVEFLFLGAAIYGGLRLYELHDLWQAPTKRDGKYYVPVKEIRIRPDVAWTTKNKFSFGLTASMNI